MDPDDLVTAAFARLRGEQRCALAKLRIKTVRDLLYHFPARYESAGPSASAAHAMPGALVTLHGTIHKPEARKTWKSRRPIAEAWLLDGSGKIKLMWFSQPYIAKTLAEGMVVKVTGRVGGTSTKPYLANPTIDRAPRETEAPAESLFAQDGAPKKSEALFPVYPESQGVSSLWFLYAIKKAFEAGAHARLVDPVPADILARYNLPSLAAALVFIHAPKKRPDAQAARKRFAFEEIFTLQISMQERRRRALDERALPVAADRKKLEEFVAAFPFPATGAQRRAIDAIARDFKKAHPMRRLLEGDVGSGKTAVAAATAYVVATSAPEGATGSLQVAYLCPTEVLAKQHFSTFVSYFRAQPIPVGLITGSEARVFPSRVRYEESAKLSKATFRKRVADGLIPIVIGTHALVEKSLSFKHLAYAIVDEQHRFGTVHRRGLVAKGGTTPHLLSMTATPIPRTLALTLYGDLDLTLLDEMPAGRKPIITEVVRENERARAYERVRSELHAGRQAYVICPRIDEPDPQKALALQAKSVKAEAVRLAQDVFPKASIGTLHSKMRPSEKEEAMQLFARGETDILVATSVVEVGVNVPNATVMVIEGAERFGLAQLHQLRGRVIRSEHQAYCFALPEFFGSATRERLKAFASAKNGFALAEYDLELRGAGELAGSHQWGVSDIAMEALKNIKMVEAARAEAARLVEEDPTLKKNPALAARVASAGANLHLE